MTKSKAVVESEDAKRLAFMREQVEDAFKAAQKVSCNQHKSLGDMGFAFLHVMRCYFKYSTEKEKLMDKKIHKITGLMEAAGRDISKGKPKAAGAVLKKAEKANEKLKVIDRDERDPAIDKYKKVKKIVTSGVNGGNKKK